MFAYLKYLSGICLILLIAAIIAIFLLAGGFNNSMRLSAAKQQAEATIGSYNQAVWKRYAPTLTTNPNSPYLASFSAETSSFFSAQPFTKVTIFSPDVLRLYYGNAAQYVTLDGTERVRLFDLEKPLAGITASQLLEGVELNGGPNPGAKRVMAHMIIPLLQPGSPKPTALVEIYTDVTAEHAKIRKQINLVLAGGGGAILVLILLLLFSTIGAENIIARQAEINRELIEAAAQAEAQSQDKSKFLASVSHELRTPLNAIIGFSDIIRNEAKERLDKIYQDYLEDIHASGKHLLSLINDILDFSKAEAGKLQIEWAETDVTKVIHNSLRMVMPRAETAQVTLVEDLPSQHLVVVTDAKKLKQVLLNLLSNAVKFTPAGGEVRCQAWTDVLTGALNIHVRDTGIGIAPKDISRVMTPFGQVDSALSRKYEGTGLGLPLAKKFVESMGGDFLIESELAVGTTVTISIPKAPPGWGQEAAPAKEKNHVEADDA